MHYYHQECFLEHSYVRNTECGMKVLSIEIIYHKIVLINILVMTKDMKNVRTVWLFGWILNYNNCIYEYFSYVVRIRVVVDVRTV